MPGEMNVSPQDIIAGGAAIRLFANDSRLVAGLKGAEARVASWVSRMTRLGAGLVIGGGALAAPFLAGANESAKMKDELGKIGVRLDELDRREYLPQFKKAVSDLSVQFGRSSDEITAALDKILTKNVKPVAAVNVLTEALRLATIGSISTQQAAEGLTQVMNSFQIPVGRSADVVDFFAKMISQGHVEMSQLIPVMEYASNMAAQSGVKLEELGAIMATMTENGVGAESTMQTLAIMLMHLKNPTVEAQRTAQEYGINLDENTLKIHGLTRVLKALADQKIPEKDLSKIFPGLEGVRGRGAKALLGNFEDYARNLTALYNRAGQAQTMLSQRMDSPIIKSHQMRQAASNLTEEIGSGLVPWLARLTDGTTGFLQKAAKWVESHRDIVDSAGGVALSIMGIGAALVILGGLIKGTMFLLSASGGLAAASFFLAAGGILYFLDKMKLTETGIGEMVDTYQVAGYSIGTWTQQLANKMYMAWVWICDQIKNLWDEAVSFVTHGMGSLGHFGVYLWGGILKGYLKMVEGILDATEWMKDQVNDYFREIGIVVFPGQKKLGTEYKERLKEAIKEAEAFGPELSRIREKEEDRLKAKRKERAKDRETMREGLDLKLGEMGLEDQERAQKKLDDARAQSQNDWVRQWEADLERMAKAAKDIWSQEQLGAARTFEEILKNMPVGKADEEKRGLGIATMGTFSGRAALALAGPGGQITSRIEESNRLLTAIKDNTREPRRIQPFVFYK